MKVVDLHQDMILTFESKPEAFFSEEWKSLMPQCNVGVFEDYKDRFDLVFGAIWPYSCEGDMQDLHNRVISFNPAGIQKWLDGYKSWWSKIALVMNKEDLNKEGCKILIHLEWHDTLASVSELKALYDQWVRSFGRTWNHDTTLSGGNKSELWLTPLGYEIMHAMNERGMIIDTAHMSWQGMREILQQTTKPILNSHSNVYTLHEHPRNIPDDVLDLFPVNGGVVGVSIYQPFISSEPEVTMDMYLDQIDYLINRIGEDHVGIGTDWHGVPRDKTVKGFEDVRGVSLLEAKMLERFGSIITEKILYSNARRVIEANLL